MTNTTISTTDLELFRQAMHDVAPLQDDHVCFSRRRLQRLPQEVFPDFSMVDPLRLPLASDYDLIDLPEQLLWMKTSLDQKLLRRLQTGAIPPNDQIDLHGLTIEQASDWLGMVLQHAQSQKWRCICVIHGKGRGVPRMKGWLNRALQTAPQVLAFCSAPTQGGGTGAVYVLLKRNKSKEK